MKTRQKKVLILLFLFISLIMATVAYTGLSTELAITSSVKFRPIVNIRVTDIILTGRTGDAIIQYEPDYDVSKTVQGFKLPDSSSLTYKVTVTNYGNIRECIYDITSTDPSIGFTVSGYDLENKQEIMPGETVEFYVTFTPNTSSEDIRNVILNYDFRKVYYVDYNANGGTNAPSRQKKYENVTLTLKFENGKPERTGYSFLGWSKVQNDDSVLYYSPDHKTDSISTINQDTELYAKWSANQIVFNNKTEEVGYSNEVTTLNITKATNGTGNYTYTKVEEKNQSNSITNYFSIVDSNDPLYNENQPKIKIAANTPSGTYTIKLKAKDNESGSEAIAIYTITVTSSSSASVGECISDLVYNGSSQTLVSGGQFVTYVNNTATDAGDHQVEAVTDNNHTFSDGSSSKTITCTISKAPITITAPSKEKVYDGTVLEIDTDDDNCFVSSGELFNNDTLTCSVTGSRKYFGTTPVSIVNNSVVIKDDQSNVVTGNYNITTANGEINITKRNTLCVSASDQRVYNGEALTVNGGTCSNLASSDTVEFINSGSIIEVGTTPNTIGSITITNSADNQEANSSYNITSTTGTLEVTKATPICTINSTPTIKYPEGNTGNLTYTCTGDGEVDVSSSQTGIITVGTPSNGTVLLTGKGLGTSSISISQSAGKNYFASNLVDTNVTVTGSNYQIEFNKNAEDATGTMANENMTYGVAKALTNNAFSRSGYSFTKWNTKADGSGTDYSNGQSVSTVTLTSSGLLKLYAIWSQGNTSYTVYHYTKNLTGSQNNYELYGSPVTKTGKTDSTITLANEAILIDGFSYSSGSLSGSTSGPGTAVTTTTILGDGSRAIYLFYNRNKYNVTLHSGTGIDSVTGTGTNIEYGTSVTIGATPKIGYEFTNWTFYNTPTEFSTNNPSNFNLSNTNYELQANAVPMNYNISYDLKNGNNPTNKPTTGTFDSVVQISNPSKTITVTVDANNTGATVGDSTSAIQTFAGWTSTTLSNTAKRGNTSNPTTAWTGAANDKTTDTYFKNLRSDKNTVTMVANWTSVPVTLPTVTKEGSTCKVYTDPTGGTEVSGSYLPNEDDEQNITLYVRCDINGHRIVINSNGGTVYETTGWTRTDNNTKAYKDIDYGNTYGTLPTVTKYGYTFTGFLDEDNNTVTSSSIVTKSQTVTAQWVVNTLGISLNLDGSSWTTSSNPSVNGVKISLKQSGKSDITGTYSSNSITFNEVDGTYELYISKDSNHLNDLVKLSDITINGNTNNLVVNYYNLTVSLVHTGVTVNGTSISNNSSLVVLGNVNHNIVASASTGYEFKTGNNIWSKTNGITISSLTNSTTTANLSNSGTITATATAKEFTVTFKYKNGDSDTTKKVTYASTYGNLPEPEWTGYSFNGWYTEETNGVKIISSTPVTITSDQTLYAHWDANSYTVTLEPGTNGSVSPNTKTVYYNSTYGTLPDASKTGYKFKEWRLDKNISSTKVTSSTTVTIASDHTLYAVYEGDSNQPVIVPKDQTIYYGDSIAQGVSALTVANLVSGDVVESVTLTASTSNATQNGTITISNIVIKRGNVDVTSEYTEFIETGKLVINPKRLEIPSSPADKTYTGSTQASGITCPTGSTSSGDTSGLDAGNYSQTCTLSSTTNYVWYQSGTNMGTSPKSISWKIKPLDITVSWENTNSYVYNGNNQGPGLTSNTVNGVTVSSVTEVINLSVTKPGKDVGNYTSTVSCTSVTNGQAKCSNYNITNGTKDYSITPKASVCTITNSPSLYYPPAETASITYSCTGDGVISVTSSSTSTIEVSNKTTSSATLTGVGLGTSIITVSQAATQNYSATTSETEATKSVLVNANTVTLNIKLNDSNWNSNNINARLKQGNTVVYSTYTRNSNKIDFTSVNKGIYNVEVSIDSNHLTSYINIGSIEVKDSDHNPEIDVNYYELIVNSPHSTLSVNSTTVSNGDVIKVFKNYPNRIVSNANIGYTFDGDRYYTTGTVTLGSSTAVSTTLAVNSESSITTLEVIIPYDIDIELNGGVEETNPNTYNIETPNISLNSPTKTVMFIGRLNNTEGSNGADSDISIGSSTTVNQTFTGWTSTSDSLSSPTKPYTMVVSTSTIGPRDFTANYADAIGTLPTIERPGFTCGWNSSSSGTTIEYASGGSYTATTSTPATVELYAVCTVHTVTVNIKEGTNNWDNTNGNMHVALYKTVGSQDQVAYSYNSASVSNNVVTFGNSSYGVQDGTYKIYAGADNIGEGVSSLTYTGVDVTVSSSNYNPSANIVYYQLTVNKEKDPADAVSDYEVTSESVMVNERLALKNSETKDYFVLGTVNTSKPVYHDINCEMKNTYYFRYWHRNSSTNVVWETDNSSQANKMYITGTAVIKPVSGINTLNIFIKKDNNSWSDSGIGIVLKKDGVNKYSSKVTSGNKATFEYVENGAYEVWVYKDSNQASKDSPSYVNSGIVANERGSIAVNYYTLNLAGVNVNSLKINSTVSSQVYVIGSYPHIINGTAASGYTFTKWESTDDSKASISDGGSLSTTVTVTGGGATVTAYAGGTVSVKIKRDNKYWNTNNFSSSTTNYTTANVRVSLYKDVSGTDTLVNEKVADGSTVTFDNIQNYDGNNDVTYKIYASLDNKHTGTTTTRDIGKTVTLSSTNLSDSDTVVNYYTVRTIYNNVTAVNIHGTEVGDYNVDNMNEVVELGEGVSHRITSTVPSTYIFDLYTRSNGTKLPMDDVESATTDFTISGGPVTITANAEERAIVVKFYKDGAATSDTNFRASLVQGGTTKYTNSAGVRTGNKLVWSGVTAGTYDLNVTKDYNHYTAATNGYIDSGIDLTQSTTNQSKPATINYYTVKVKGTNTNTLTFNGTSIASNDDTGVPAVAGYAHSISAQKDSGFTFTGWTSSSGGTFGNASSLSTTFTPTDTTTIRAVAGGVVTVKIRKDGATYTGDETMGVALYKDGSPVYAYNTSDHSKTQAIFSGVANNTYDVYSSIGGGSSVLRDTGVDVVVSASSLKPTVYIDYYTITVKYTNMDSIEVHSGNVVDDGDSVILASGDYEHILKGTASTGYEFQNWQRSNSNVTFNDNTSNNTKFTVSGKSTITGRAVAKTATVIYHRNYSCSDTTTKTITYKYGESNQKFGSKTLFSRDGYSLKGWGTTCSTSTVSHNCSSTVTNSWINNNSTNDVDLYAIWEPLTVKITYMRNRDINDSVTSEKTFTFNISNQKHTDNGWNYPGHTLLGYSKNRTSKTAEYVLNSTVSDELFTNYSENGITLYAVWDPIKVRVTYHRNTNSNDSATVYQDFNYDGSGQQFGYENGTKKWGTNGQFGDWDYSGWTLEGWATTYNATSASYSPYNNVGAVWILSNSPSIDLYAVWTQTSDSPLCGTKSCTDGSICGYNYATCVGRECYGKIETTGGKISSCTYNLSNYETTQCFGTNLGQLAYYNFYLYVSPSSGHSCSYSCYNGTSCYSSYAATCTYATGPKTCTDPSCGYYSCKHTPYSKVN